jgi:hypothetical protein
MGAGRISQKGDFPMKAIHEAITWLQRARWATPVFVLLAAAATLLPRPSIADTRHHITLGLGYAKLPSDDLKDDSIGIDFTNAANGVLSYRYSLNSSWDVCLDSRGTISTDSQSGVDLTLMNSYFGPGLRWNAPGTARFFGQASFFFVSESAEAEQGGLKISASDGGTGFGVFGGLDFPVSTLLSIPVELGYIYAKPADDISGFGATVGLTFNFGEMK